MDALDPIDCIRCKRRVPVDEATRPEWIKTYVHAPITPRPVLPGGTRVDGTVVGPTQVTWLIEGDMDKPGSTVAVLCSDCLELLRNWLYLSEPAEGDRVRLTYGDGSTVEGTWRGHVERDDGELHTHTRGHVRRDVIARASVR